MIADSAPDRSPPPKNLLLRRRCSYTRWHQAMFGCSSLLLSAALLQAATIGVSPAAAAAVLEERPVTTSGADDELLTMAVSKVSPVIVRSPNDQFVVRNRPAELVCRALNAVQIRFKCNGDWVDDEKLESAEGTDVESGLPYVEAKLSIERKQVEEFFGLRGFRCECFASSGAAEHSVVKSQEALVKVAYMRKHFYSAPSSETKPRLANVRFPCVPPDGDPPPQIFWEKNGVRLRRGDYPNVIVANDGSLLVSEAQLTDSGNYSCVAHNVATTRVTAPAHLRVYVDGSWTHWSDWTGSCNMDCDQFTQRLHRLQRRRPSGGGGGGLEELLPRLYRTRQCADPLPANGGAECSGASDEQTECPLACPVDGAWTQWSAWSRCSNKCHQIRTRGCADPVPRNGGRLCHGAEFDTRNCSKGDCGVSPAVGAGSRAGAGRGGNGGGASADWQTGMALYAGLALTSLLFLIVVALICFILCRRSKCCAKRKNGDIYYSSGHSSHLRTVLSMQPDLTQEALLVHGGSCGGGSVKRPYSALPRRPTPESSNFSLRSGGRHMAGSRSALIGGGGGGGGGSSGRSTAPSVSSAEKQRCVSRNSDDNYATLYDCAEERENQRNSIISSALPTHIEIDSVAVAKFDHRGGRLSLPQCGATLTIPEGALERRQVEDIYIAVCRDPADRPRLAEGQTSLSPVLWCGPAGLTFRKPIIVSFPHCAQLFPHNNWDVMLFVSGGLPNQSSEWQHALTMGEENVNTPAYVQMDLDSVHVMTDDLCRFALVGETAAGQLPAIKRMKLAAFAPLYPSSLDYSIRVYCVEDTDSAVQEIMDQEERLGGCLVAELRDLACMEGGDLCFCLEDVSRGWRVKPAANYQEIPAAHAWSGGASGPLHCSFALELCANDGADVNLSARVVVCQKGASGHRQILLVNTSAAAAGAAPPTPPPVGLTTRSDSGGAQTIVTSLEGSSERNSPTTVALGAAPTGSGQHGGFKLAHSLKKALCALLDPPTETENDWRMLARKLNVDRYIQYFGWRPSPTEHILDLWEAKEEYGAATVQLLQILRSMGRLDAAALLEDHLARHPVPL